MSATQAACEQAQRRELLCGCGLGSFPGTSFLSHARSSTAELLTVVAVREPLASAWQHHSGWAACWTVVYIFTVTLLLSAEVETDKDADLFLRAASFPHDFLEAGCIVFRELWRSYLTVNVLLVDVNIDKIKVHTF